MNENKPVLGITIGDPASIGPEIALKALSDKGVYNISNPLLIGDSKLLQQVKKAIGIGVNINVIENCKQAIFQYGTIDVLDLKNVEIDKLQYGAVSSMAGKASFEYVKKPLFVIL